MVVPSLNYILLAAALLINTSFVQSSNKSSLSGQNGWKLEKEKSNIKIYTRNAEGSKIKEFKSVTVIAADMEFLEKLIDNVSNYPAWQANIATAKILKQVNNTTRYIYYTTTVPWPVTNRDVVLLSVKFVDVDGTITYNLTGEPDYIKEKADFIRIKNIKSMCRIKPLGNKKIEITFESFGDPRGYIPDSLINMFMIDSPFNTLVNLKKIVGNKNP